MSHGRDDDDPPKGPNVLLLIPGKGKKPDRLFKRDRDEDRKRELVMTKVEPRVVGKHTIVSVVPNHNLNYNSGLDSFLGLQVRGMYSRDANAGFASIVRKNPFGEEMIVKMAQLAELTGDDSKYSILAGCDDGKIRLFNFTFEGDGKHTRDVETFDEPVVFFPNHYYRTKTQLVKTLQDRVDMQVAALQRYFDPEFYQMNFAGFQ